MDQGVINLGDREITTALTDEVITRGSSASGNSQELIDSLDFLASVSLQAKVVGGNSGSSIVVVVQTSLDQGASWIDVARFDFTTGNAQKTCNLSANAAAAVAAVSALGAEGKVDGILGDRLRAKVTSQGTYTATTVSVRAAVR